MEYALIYRRQLLIRWVGEMRLPYSSTHAEVVTRQLTSTGNLFGKW